MLKLDAAAREMALFGLPLIEMAATRARMFRGGLTPNRFNHVRALLTHRDRTVTQPNVDTLYSSAWIDLSKGPVRIVLPPTVDRYFSLALMDMFTNNFAVLGARTVGGDGGEFLLVGPSDALPEAGAIRSPTNWVWALARTLVRGEEDLSSAHAVQDGLIVIGPSSVIDSAFVRRDTDWPELFAAIQRLVLENRPPATDVALFRRTAALGVGLNGGFEPRCFSAAEGAQIVAGLAEALNAAKEGDSSGAPIGAWVFPRPNLGQFGQDYLYRAQIALSGLAALPVDEALYLRALGPDGGATLDGASNWRLRLPNGSMPASKAFWSLTAYEVTPTGQAFLIDNPLGRYALGDRSAGLACDAGDFDLRIGPDDPGPRLRSSWLPTRGVGTITLNLRIYTPAPDLMTGRWRLPALERAPA